MFFTPKRRTQSMWKLAGQVLVLALLSVSAWADESFSGALFQRDQLSSIDVSQLKGSGFDTVVLEVSDHWIPSEKELDQVQSIQSQGLAFAIWIEIARDARLADQHPEWMASIQGHPEWRRFYPDFPKLKERQVVKVYPWVPIAYQEAFAVQLEKVKRILALWPKVERVFLNDLQGAPSACGCGHPLCRWTTDYGPIKTATPLASDFAAKFVGSVRKIRDGLEVIPVWATECEEGDKPGLCAGVGCYRGACWREWSAQLEPLVANSPRIGALLLESTFQRAEMGPDWLAAIPQTFAEMPAHYQRAGIATDRLVAIIEGWQADKGSLERQRRLLKTAGISSYVVAMTMIDQRWDPRVFDLPTQ